MNLTTENTAIVLDSTSDFPEARDRYTNMRVVPLYVSFGEESFRDHVDIGSHDFYERLKAAPALPTTSQPTPQDFLSTFEELGAYERVYALHLSAKLSGTFQSATLAATGSASSTRRPPRSPSPCSLWRSSAASPAARTTTRSSS
jgi:DegV family protein with EDD domain